MIWPPSDGVSLITTRKTSVGSFANDRVGLFKGRRLELNLPQSVQECIFIL